MKRREFLITTGAAAGLTRPAAPRPRRGRPDRLVHLLGPERARLLDQLREAAVRGGQPRHHAQPRRRRRRARQHRHRRAGAGGAAAQRRPAGRLLRELRPAPARRRHRGRALRQHEGGRALQLVEDQPARHRHRLFDALPRQPGAARLRHRQAQARGRAEDLRGARRLDQGEPRPVHLQPPRQGRLRRQLRPPGDLRGERQGPGRLHRRQLHRRRPPRRRSPRPGRSCRTSRPRSSTRAPTPRATPSRCSCSASRPSP